MHNRQWAGTFRANGVCQCFCQIFFLSLSLLSPVSLPCMPQMFSLVAPTDRNLLARRKARSSPGERSTKPPVCTQQMQKASPSATSSLCHMDLRDLIQEGTFFLFFFFFFFNTSAYTSLFHIHRIKYKHTSKYGRCNSKIKFIGIHWHVHTRAGIQAATAWGYRECKNFNVLKRGTQGNYDRFI